MINSFKSGKEKFFVELIKPSHYDNDGYVIQWWRSFSLSNSLSCLYSLTLDSAERKILGENVDIIANLHDEHSTLIPIPAITRRIRQNGNRGIILLVGVQTNQFPRSVDIARPFREADIPVVIGGFHVSAAISVLTKIPPDAQKALDMGISLFSGEAEGHLDQLFSDAYHQKLKPIYSVTNDLPDLRSQPIPLLPQAMIKKSLSSDIPIDTSRGCPFDCSFCTIINIQGQKSRFRTADDVERMVCSYSRNGRKTPHFF
ncbi:MAG: radical SAM protein, partial [Deltaproteobacteria bacterium]|nr:radical SAM protein [Deltaproteobacteria bacterium]